MALRNLFEKEIENHVKEKECFECNIRFPNSLIFVAVHSKSSNVCVNVGGHQAHYGHEGLPVFVEPAFLRYHEH